MADPRDAANWSRRQVLRLLEGAPLAALSRPAFSQAGPSSAVLENRHIAAEFDGRGLRVLTGRPADETVQFSADRFTIVLDGREVRGEDLPAPRVEPSAQRISYRFTAPPFELEVVYELRPDWRFLSKQLFVTGPAGESFRVGRVDVLRCELAAPAVQDAYVPSTRYPRLQTQDYGAFLRFEGSRGLFALVQNPFLSFERHGGAFALPYEADMEWDSANGPFASDRGCLGPYKLSGRRLPATMLPEWKRPAAGDLAGTGADRAEIEAFTGCVCAFLLYRPEKPSRVHVGWCENDYQIDVATPEGRDEYRRIIDRIAELGVGHVIYTPANSELARREDSVDDWKWEYVLWLGLGQKIRKGEWDPKRDPLPESVREMLAYIRSKGVKPLAYVYPPLPFQQNPEWLVPDPERGTTNANLGIRSFQHWLIENLAAFYRNKS